MPLNTKEQEKPMSAHCHDDHCHDAPAHASPRYRRVLWIALVLNALMFVVEISAGFRSGSVSLLADAIDFFGDAANYAVSLAVLGMALAWRARAAFVKGLCMLAFGLFVIGKALWAARTGTPPEALTMGITSLLALAVNVGVAMMLYAWRAGDANMRSVWLCSRNDAIGNLAVLVAALGVAGTRTAWPDLAVALGMGALALTSAYSVLRQARGEMQAQIA
jgi:cation diffusion facilitator family transporter